MAEENKQAQAQPTAAQPRHLVRVLNNDLKGDKQILYALTKIKGVGLMFANAVCKKAGIPENKRTGFLTEKEVSSLEHVITRPAAAGIPIWMFNRRSDLETGETSHLITSNLDFTHDMDIKRMKKTRSYKGYRHQWGQPVRGQKTKSNFRKNKGKGSLGVQKKKTAAPAKSAVKGKK